MADEELTPEGGAEGIVAPEDERQPDPNTNDGDPNPIEALAAKMGWAPKDQFRGAEDEWKPADEFILASKDINKGLSRELRGMRDQLDRVTRTSAQIMADKLAERDAHWQGVHERAVEQGDTALAKRAVTELGKLEQQKASVQPGNDLPPETQAFTEKHATWFGKDPLATARAKRLAAELAQDGYDVPTQLREVERAIRKEFPEHFGPPAKTPPATTTATARSDNRGSRPKGFNDMPEESRKLAKDYETRFGIKPEDFAKSYWADQQRRVG